MVNLKDIIIADTYTVSASFQTQFKNTSYILVIYSLLPYEIGTIISVLRP